MAPENTGVMLLNAPVRAVTLKGGERMHSWYDVMQLGKEDGPLDNRGIDQGQLEDSTKMVMRFMHE